MSEKIDFASMIGEINAAGYTQKDIEEETGIPQSSISRYLNNHQRPSTPEFTVALLALHKKVQASVKRRKSK